MLGICYASVEQTRQWEEGARAVARSNQVIEQLERLSLQTTDAEAAAQRFIVNPRTVDLARCRRSLAQAVASEQELETLLAGSLATRQKIQAVRQLIDHQARMLLGSLPPEGATAEATAGTSRDVREALTALDNAGLSSNLRSAILSMEADENRALAERTVWQQSTLAVSRVLFLAASTVSVILIIFAGWRIRAEQRKRNALQQRLGAKEEQYRRVVELAGDIICRTDEHGRFTLCNQAALDLLHFSHAEIIGRAWLKFVRQDKRAAAQRFYRRQIGRRRNSTFYELPLIDGHGGERWVALHVQLVIENNRIAGLQAIGRDITDRRRIEAELQRSRTFAQRIAAMTPGILCVYDLAEKRSVYSNREMISVLGYKPEDMPNMTALHEFCHPDDRAMIEQHREALRHAPEGEIRRLEYRMRHADGHWVWLSAVETAFERGPDGLVKQVVSISQDITARKEAQEKLTYHANFDALTGLRNRQHFWSGLQSVLRRASIGHYGTSLCLFDVDHFKEINDRFGHGAGDEVLEAVGNIVRAELRVTDLAGRLGGDEFCFALPRTGGDECARVAERIRNRLSTLAFGLGTDAPFSVTATFGVAESDPDVNAKELMEAADRALYQAKAEGRNRVTVAAA